MGPIKKQDHMFSLGKYVREFDGLTIDSGHREIGRDPPYGYFWDGILSQSNERRRSEQGDR
jgi:hypothetical protein